MSLFVSEFVFKKKGGSFRKWLLDIPHHPSLVGDLVTLSGGKTNHVTFAVEKMNEEPKNFHDASHDNRERKDSKACEKLRQRKIMKSWN